MTSNQPTMRVFACLVIGAMMGIAAAYLTSATPIAEARTPQGSSQQIFQDLEDRCDCNTQVLVELELILATLDEDCQCGGGVCGDGTLDPGEECDDGGNQDGDGCSANCRVEVGACCFDAVPTATYSLYVLQEIGCDDNVTLFDCEEMGGFWQGPGSVCDDGCFD